MDSLAARSGPELRQQGGVLRGRRSRTSSVKNTAPLTARAATTHARALRSPRLFGLQGQAATTHLQSKWHPGFGRTFLGVGVPCGARVRVEF